jgi:hypothetical protein
MQEKSKCMEFINCGEIHTFRHGTYQNLPPRIILGKDGALNIPTMPHKFP